MPGEFSVTNRNASYSRETCPVIALKGDQMKIDTEQSIYSPALVGMVERMSDGTSVKIVAEIRLPGENEETMDAALVRFDRPDGSIKYAFGGLEAEQENGPKMLDKGIERFAFISKDEPLLVGRSKDRDNAEKLWKDQKYSDDVSRLHLVVGMNEDGEITIQDCSQNGTVIAGYKKSELVAPTPAPIDSVPVDRSLHYRAEHTLSAMEAARVKGMLGEVQYGDEQQKTFGKHQYRVISRDTSQFEGAVDIRSWNIRNREQSVAIAIDSRHYREEYKQLFDHCWRELLELQQVADNAEARALKAIYNTVHSQMEYDLDFAKKLPGKVLSATDPDREINLGAYLQAKKGVCSHMALSSAWLGNKLAEHGFLKGKITTGVNTKREGDVSLGAHQWMRYESLSDEVWIIDPAQHFVGRIEEVLDNPGLWEYFREGEKKELIARRLAKQAIKGSGGVMQFLKRKK